MQKIETALIEKNKHIFGKKFIKINEVIKVLLESIHNNCLTFME